MPATQIETGIDPETEKSGIERSGKTLRDNKFNPNAGNLRQNTDRYA